MPIVESPDESLDAIETIWETVRGISYTSTAAP